MSVTARLSEGPVGVPPAGVGGARRAPIDAPAGSAPAAALALSALVRRFGAKTAVDGVDLEIAPGELFCLLGPSGCGKTTLLRLIGGYVAPNAGRIELAGKDITDAPLAERSIGMVFQSYALFPHLSARENIEFGLRARGRPRSECRERADAMLTRVGLDAATGDRLPGRLSGGEQQRVALARALLIEPKLLLLDEPLASLDRRLREVMRHELKALQRRTGVTTIMVTHDQEDAMFLADRVGVMMNGQLLQVGSPETLYHRPQRAEVARFLGDANLLTVQAADAGVVSVSGGLSIPTSELPAARPGQLVMLRPEDLRLSDPADGRPPNGVVVSTTFMGADAQVMVRGADGEPLLVRLRQSDLPVRPDGDAVHVSPSPGTVWLIPDAPLGGAAASPDRHAVA